MFHKQVNDGQEQRCLLRWQWLLGSVLALSLFATVAPAQVEDPVVAVVGDQEILRSRIVRHLDRMLSERELTGEQRKKLEIETLQHFVKREIVNHYLILRKFDVGPNQILLELGLLEGNLERVGQTLEEFLTRENQTRQGLENEIAWKLRWDEYLTKTLTDKVLQSYFDRHRRKFDGTEIRVSQILFPSSDTEKSIDNVIQLASDTKTTIESGAVTWSEAVQSNSIAPSKGNDGEVGWIRFAEPMPREFTDTAFALEPDGIAEPFASSFGVHLIKCLEVRPGKAEFGDVRRAVQEAATKELFERIADRHQTELKVEFSEGWRIP